MRDLPRLPLDAAAFRERYGPWAVIAGASEGTGECYARQLAEMGINLVLVSRRKDALEKLGKELAAEHGIDYLACAQDLTEADAGLKIVEAAAELDVGLYISNVGADGFAAFFEDSTEKAHRLVRMNITTLIDAVNGFGKRLLARGKGGMIVMASGAGLGGQPNLAMYSATKAFEINFAESLWAEYHDHAHTHLVAHGARRVRHVRHLRPRRCDSQRAGRIAGWGTGPDHSRWPGSGKATAGGG